MEIFCLHMQTYILIHQSSQGREMLEGGLLYTSAFGDQPWDRVYGLYTR